MKKGVPVMRCGDCRFHACEKYFEKPCEQLGKLEVSKQCEKFKPDVRALDEFLANQEKSRVLQAIGELTSLIPTSKLHILAAVLYNEKNTRKYGFNFMQRVYIPWRGHNDSLDVVNFKRMFVMEASKKELRLLSSDGKVYYVQYSYKDSLKAEPLYTTKSYSGTVYTVEAFKSLREKLKEKGISIQVVETKYYELRTSHKQYIEVEAKDSEDKDGKAKSKANYDIYDLSTMAREVEKGYIVKSKSYKRKQEENDDSEVFRVNFGK